MFFAGVFFKALSNQITTKSTTVYSVGDPAAWAGVKLETHVDLQVC